jgi:hypothetical protein
VLLTFHAWIANNNFVEVQSDMRLLVRNTLTAAGFGPPVPVPAPAVAPWTPPTEDERVSQAKMAN